MASGAAGALGAMLVVGRARNCVKDDLRGMVPMTTGTDTLKFELKPLVSHVNCGICFFLDALCFITYLNLIFDIYVGTPG